MSLTQIQQIHQFLEGAKNILIVFRKDGDGDTIASALALNTFLEKIGKKVDIVSDDFNISPTFSFLKGIEKIKKSFSDLQRFVISINTEKTGLQNLSYDIKDKNLRIFITPKQGSFSKDSISTAQTDFKYDIIFTINTPDLNSLENIYKNNTELFFKLPIINIDHQADNEHYGQINIIEPTDSSTSETIFSLFKKLGGEYVDAEMATALLTGIISKTHSFRADFIKPHTLSAAGELMTLGANKEKIIDNLYRTRTITALKLWGRMLSNIKTHPEQKLVWSTLTRDDFVRCGAKESDLKDIVNELIRNSPEAKIILLLHEHTGNSMNTNIVHGVLSTDKNHDALMLVQEYNPAGNKNHASFVLEGKSLQEAEDEMINFLLRKLR